MSDATQAPEKKGARVVVLLVLGLLLLVGAGYVAAYYAASDRVPRGTTIEDVEVGGLTRAAAERTLRRELSGAATSPMTVSLEGEEVRLDPADAGLTVDYEASVDGVGGRRSWDPSWLWDYFTGGDEADAVVTVDEAALEEELARLGRDVEREARDGAVSIRGGRLEVRQARTGRAIDVEASAEAVRTAYLTDEEPELTVTDVQPDIDDADVQSAVREFGNPAVSGPVRIQFGKATVRLTPQQYSRAVSMEPQDSVLVPTVNRKRLFALVDRNVSGNGVPRDAQVRLVDGRPRVIPAQVGVTYRKNELASTFLRLVSNPDDRTGRVKAKVAQPAFTTKEARDLRIREQVSTFTTYFPYAEYRNVNIGRAAEIVDGTVLEPGEVFSLNGIVGERTRANGFTEGFIISDGIFKEDLGGGVSQVATTLFNAMFFAGLEDVEHKPHSFYIDRYPIGREATVAWGAVDLRFRNDTPYGVLVDTSVTPSTPSSSGSITVSMWSTEYWDITTTTSDRYNLTEEETRRLDSEDCYPHDGYGGFDIDVYRYFRRAGESELHHQEKFTTTYTPSDTVICTNPEAQDG